MEFFIVLVVGGLCILLAVSLKNRKKKAIIATGAMIDREDRFFKQAHIFTTQVNDISHIAEAIDRNVLSEHRISFEPNVASGQIVFRNQINFGTFGARLALVGQENGVAQYRFQVEGWREMNNGITRQDLFGANILLTAIERAFLRLDPQTNVQHMAAQYRSRPRIF